MDKDLTLAGIPGPFVEAVMIARDWWREDHSRLMPGEEGGVTVFEVLFGDGCRHLGHTELTVFECVDDSVASPFPERRSAVVANHVARMGLVVRVVASNLGAVAAAELRDELVRTAPEGMQNVDGSGLEAQQCFLSEVPAEPVRMSFAEWMKKNEDPESEGEN